MTISKHSAKIDIKFDNITNEIISICNKNYLSNFIPVLKDKPLPMHPEDLLQLSQLKGL